MANEQQDGSDPYPVENIKVFTGLEHVRKWPGMYIGDVGQSGLHRMVFPLVGNALAEAAEGYGCSVRVQLNADGSVAVEDQGRGIVGSPHPAYGEPLLEALLTGFVTASSPLGRRWFDYAVANGLAEWLRIETRQDGQTCRQEYRRGEPVAAPQQAAPCPSSGVKVTLKPDPSIFSDPRFCYRILRDRLENFAFLHSRVRISIADEATGHADTFEFEDGIRSLVEKFNRDRKPLHRDVLVVRGEQEGVKYEAGIQWCRERDEIMRSFVNDEETSHAGTHVTGLLAAVTRSINSFLRRQDRSGGGVLKGEEARRGLTAVVSVRLAHPEFGGATKARLVSQEARRAVGAGVGRVLREFFESNPKAVEAVVRAATPKARKGQ